MKGCTALVLAGSRPGTDAFAQGHGTDLKALIPVAGEPMVARPVAALLASPWVTSIIVLAQDPDRIAAVLPGGVETRSSDSTIAATLERICADPKTAWPLLVTTADHALLSPEMIDEFRSHALGADVALGFVERRNLVLRLPHAKRTWLKFKGGAYTGANLFLLGSPKVAPAISLWRSVEQDRKKGWRLLLAVGPLTLIGTALRLLTLRDVLAKVGRRLDLDIRAVELSDPLAGVDVDKDDDHRLVEAIIAGRA